MKSGANNSGRRSSTCSIPQKWPVAQTGFVVSCDHRGQPRHARRVLRGLGRHGRLSDRNRTRLPEVSSSGSWHEPSKLKDDSHGEQQGVPQGGRQGQVHAPLPHHREELHPALAPPRVSLLPFICTVHWHWSVRLSVSTSGVFVIESCAQSETLSTHSLLLNV